MSTEGIFGTDGIRGRAGEGWLTAEAAAKVGWAAGRVLSRGVRTRALLGHDGRRSGPQLEDALASGLAAAGVAVASAGLIPTPGLAWLTRERDFGLGVMISASHNPSHDNGIKLFSDTGGKLSDETQAEIEGLLASAEAETGAQRPEDYARPVLDPDLESAYLEHLVRDAGRDLRLDGMSLVIDCANGAASRVAPRVLGRLGAQVHAVACEPDGENINRGCGSTEPRLTQSEVRGHGARAGIALDGDGDRCILVDEAGELVHGDGIMTIVARHAMAQGAYADPRIVATVMSNRGLHRALRAVGVEVVEVGVGDRQVVEALRREGLDLGGEQSGHIILGEENGFIGDGVVTALKVLRVMQETGKSLSALAAAYQPMPQVLLNVRVSSKPSLADLPAVSDLVRRIESDLGADGRVLLRYSGTEDLARVMVEGLDHGSIQSQAEELATRIRAEIGAR